MLVSSKPTTQLQRTVATNGGTQGMRENGGKFDLLWAAFGQAITLGDRNEMVRS